MTFAERFDGWLQEQGKDPLSETAREVLDKAAQATLEFMRTEEAKAALLSGFQEIVDAHKAGARVDPHALAKQKLDEAEQAIRNREDADDEGASEE